MQIDGAATDNNHRLEPLFRRIERIARHFSEATEATFRDHSDDSGRRKLAETIERHQLMRWVADAVQCQKPRQITSLVRYPKKGEVASMQQLKMDGLKALLDKMREQNLPVEQAKDELKLKKLSLSEDYGPGEAGLFGVLLHLLTGVHMCVCMNVCMYV